MRMLLELTASSLPILSLYISKNIINNLTTHDLALMRSTLFLIILTFGLTLLNGIIGAINNYISQCHGEKIDLLISEIKYKKSVEIDIAYLDSPDYYNNYLNATTNASYIQSTIWNLYQTLGLIIKAITCFIAFSRYSIGLSILLITICFPSILVENHFKKVYMNLQKELIPYHRKIGYIGSIFTQQNYAIDIRTNSVFDFLLSKLKSDWIVKYKKNNDINKNHIIKSFFASHCPQIIILAYTIYLTVLVFKQELLVGDYTYVTACIQQLVGTIIGVVGGLTRYIDNISRVLSFIEFIEIENQVTSEGTLSLNYEHVHIIKFENVSFSYPKTNGKVLDNISFEFSTTDKIALVGQNGSGKTTITKLLLRLYDVDQGAIYIDGINIKQYKLSDIRHYFGLMQQTYNKYSFTLRENIAFSDIDDVYNDNRVRTALHMANADSIHNKLSENLDAYLTRIYNDDGVELSGGEWQKIALARTFFKQAKILILDEPSSAIDAKAEDELFNTVYNEFGTQGMLLISHRLSNIRFASKIIVLNNSHIVESGTHLELMNLHGLYYEMYTIQQQKYQ